jgi:hypothetical protein
MENYFFGLTAILMEGNFKNCGYDKANPMRIWRYPGSIQYL